MSKKKETRIETDGGAYIGGKMGVHGGDFVGRDKIVHSIPQSGQPFPFVAPCGTM